MSQYRNPEPAYEEEEEDPRPRDRWGRFLTYDDQEEEEPIEEEFAEASVEEEPVEEDGYQDEYEPDDDYE